MENNIEKNDDIIFVINNNFTSISFGVIFWLMIHIGVGYGTFYGNTIDWTVNEPWYIIIKSEMEKSFRFSGVIFAFLIANIMAFKTLYKTLKKPKKIIFKDDGIFCDKSFNDLQEIKFTDIEEIKKAYYSLHLTGYNNVDLKFIFLSIIAMPLVLFFNIISNVIKIIFFNSIKFYVKNKFYITIFSKRTNRVVNIPINNQDEYNKLKDYFIKYMNINLDTVKTNYKLSNIKKEESNVRNN